MAEVGSDAWLEGLNERLATLPPMAGSPLVVQQRIEDAGDVVEFFVTLGHAPPRAQRGRAERPDVELHQSRETATAIAAGDLAAEEAFITGVLGLRGDVDKLLEVHGALTDMLGGRDA